MKINRPLYVLGIVILCIGFLYLLFGTRPRTAIEGFEEVRDCISVTGVRYVRLYATTLLPQAQQFLTLTQVRVLDENGNNLALGKPVNVRGATNLSPTVLTDGSPSPRLEGPGRSWTTPMAGQDEYVEIDLGSPQTVAAVVYMGAQDAPRQRNRGVRITLLDGNRQPILGGNEYTKEDDIQQTVTFCKRGRLFIIEFIPAPANIKCSQTLFSKVAATVATPQGSQWLCETDEDAQKLFKGPFDKAKRYLRDGDQVCVLTADGIKYSCYEPYDGTQPISYYQADSTQYDVQDSVGGICGMSAAYLKDLSNSVLGIRSINDTVSTGLDALNNSERDLQALYDGMLCRTQQSGGLKTICDSIATSIQDIQAKKVPIQGVSTAVSVPLARVTESRSHVNDLLTKYNCR